MPTKSKGPTQRQLRVGELVRHSLSELLSRRAIHDDVINSTIVTISEVRMSPDLRIATAYVMPLGGGDASRIIKALAANSKFIRGQIAKAVKLKFAPEMRFLEDETFDESMRIDRVLNSEQVRRDVEGEG